MKGEWKKETGADHLRQGKVYKKRTESKGLDISKHVTIIVEMYQLSVYADINRKPKIKQHSYNIYRFLFLNKYILFHSSLRL